MGDTLAHCSDVMDSVSLGLGEFSVWGLYAFPFKRKHYSLVEVEVYHWALFVPGSGKPVLMTLLGDLPLVQSQPSHCLSFFADKGELFVWGKNIRGCLGIGRLEDQYFPWRVRLDWEDWRAGPQGGFT